MGTVLCLDDRPCYFMLVKFVCQGFGEAYPYLNTPELADYETWEYRDFYKDGAGEKVHLTRFNPRQCTMVSEQEVLRSLNSRLKLIYY